MDRQRQHMLDRLNELQKEYDRTPPGPARQRIAARMQAVVDFHD